MIWYEKNCIFVKWNSAISNSVSLSHGVRQGGVLSPILFALYVDKMLCDLNRSGIGCIFEGFPIAALMYADDIILITASVTHLRELIKICDNGLRDIDLQINIAKSTLIRVGCQFQDVCEKIGQRDDILQVSSEVKFLGSVILSGVKFSISLSKNKINFYRNANKILSKIGNSNLPVRVHLIDAYCVSTLLYNLEIFDLNKSKINSLLFAVNRLLMKILKTSDIVNVQYSLFCFGKLPIDILLPIRKLKYLQLQLKKMI